MLGRLSDLEMPTHLIEFLSKSHLLVPFGEITNDLIGRVPPALTGCDGAVLLPALSGIRPAQHLDRQRFLSSVTQNIFRSGSHIQNGLTQSSRETHY